MITSSELELTGTRQLTRTRCGDFWVNGMWGTNNDYVLDMLVRCQHRGVTPKLIRCGVELFISVVKVFDLHRKPGDKDIDASALDYFGAHVMVDSEMPPGEMWFSFGMKVGGDGGAVGEVVGVLSGFHTPLNCDAHGLIPSDLTVVKSRW